MFRWRIYSATTMDQPELIPNTCFSGGKTWAPGGEHANSTQESNPTPSYCEARVLTSLHPPPLLQLIPTKKCFGLCLFGCGLLFLSHACETSEPPLKKKKLKIKGWLCCLYLCRLPAHKALRSVLLALGLVRGRGGKHIFGERKQGLMLSDHHCHQLLDLRSRCGEAGTGKDYGENVSRFFC